MCQVIVWQQPQKDYNTVTEAVTIFTERSSFNEIVKQKSLLIDKFIMETEEPGLEGSHLKKNSTLRRRGGMKLTATSSNPRRNADTWRKANLRQKKHSLPIVRPPLPPKPESLQSIAANRRGKTFDLSPSTFQSPPSSNEKTVMTRTKSAQGSSNKNSDGSLIERRKQFFHQLSQSSTEKPPTQHKSIEKKVLHGRCYQ